MKIKFPAGLSALLLSLASCSSDEIVQESPNPDGQPYISFASLVQKSTRFGESVEVTTPQALRDDDDGFRLHAFDANYKDYIPEQRVKYTTKHGITSFWPENDYYWPGSPLTFVAWYPYNYPIKNETFRAPTHTYYITPELLGINATDALVAVSKISHPSSWTAEHPLQFQHLFAQICINAKSDATKYQVEVSNVALRYMNAWGSANMVSFDTSSDFSAGDLNIRTTPDICSKNFFDDKITGNEKDFDKYQIKTAPTTPEEVKNYYDAYKNQYVCAFYAVDEAAESYITLTNNMSQLVGGTKDGKNYNGFLVMRQRFDYPKISDNTDYENNPHDDPAQSWKENDKDITGAYLAVKIKLTPKNEDGTLGTTFYEGWSAIPAFDHLSIKSGYRYIFNLTFTDDGAGQIPPGEEDGGKPILGKPMHFTVTCDEWEANTKTVATTPTNDNVTD